MQKKPKTRIDTNCTSMPISSYIHSHILITLFTSTVVTLQLTPCVPPCCHYLIRHYKHTLKSITASLQWNNMYMFSLKKCWHNGENESSWCRNFRPFSLTTGGRVSLRSFCGETSFYFLKAVKTDPSNPAKCATSERMNLIQVITQYMWIM